MTTAVVERRNEILPAHMNQFMPVMTMELAKERFLSLRRYVEELMVPGKDFGVIPGSDKPTLLKPGAEKLCTLFGLCVPDPEFIESVKDWSGREHGEPFFYFEVRQRLVRDGQVISSQVGSANSMEAKHRYRWIAEHEIPPGLEHTKLKRRGGVVTEFFFAVDKAETGGKYGKPAEYWQRFRDAIADGTARHITKKTRGNKEMDAWEIDGTIYRVPNPEVADLVNTLQKMAQKRALIAATLIAVNASEFFTQDLEDLEPSEHAEPVQQATPAQQSPPQNHANGKPAGPEPYITAEQAGELRELIRDARGREEDAAKQWGLDYVDHLPAARFAKVKENLLNSVARRTAVYNEAMTLVGELGITPSQWDEYFQVPSARMNRQQLEAALVRMREIAKSAPAAVADSEDVAF